MSVVSGVQSDLDRMKEAGGLVEGTALAESALALAREMDEPNSATSKSMCARALVETLNELKALVPEQPKGSKVDELRARRTARNHAA